MKECKVGVVDASRLVSCIVIGMISSLFGGLTAIKSVVEKDGRLLNLVVLVWVVSWHDAKYQVFTSE